MPGYTRSSDIRFEALKQELQELVAQARKEGFEAGYKACEAEVAARIATSLGVVRKPAKKGKRRG